MLTSLRLLACLILASSMSACGSGGGDNGFSGPTPTPATPPPPSATGVAYSAVATAGELVNFTLDSSKLAYSYNVISSQFGLTGVTGSGTLITNNDGTYTPQDIPNARIFTLQNGMMIGAVRLSINGTQRAVPLIGFQNLASVLTNDTLNTVQRICTDATQAACASSYGTMRINADGTWVSCDNSNYDENPGACNGRRTGTLNALSVGKWQVLASTSAELGTALAFQASNGQNVWVIDLNQSVANGGLGMGVIAGASKLTANPANTDGTWLIAGTTGALQYTGSLTLSDTNYTANATAVSGTGSVPIGGSATLVHNVPWTGLVQSSTGVVAFLAATGFYAGVNPSNGSIEVGLKK